MTSTADDSTGDAEAPAPPVRFSLAGLFEYVTVCSVPLAFAPFLGLASSFLLSLTSLALAFRQGLLALFLALAASLATDFPGPNDDESFVRQIVALALAAALGAWYYWRRK